MSDTKLQNAKGELISKVDINAEKLSAKSSRCSCIDCDPEGCFEKRKKSVKVRCQCGSCRDLRSSSTFPNKDCRDSKGYLESATKKIIREIVTKQTIESLKRVTETMYEFGTKEHFGMIAERQSVLSDKKSVLTPTKSQISSKKECYKQRPFQVPSKDVSQPHKNNTATKLGAQVMNVPYEDIHKSVTSHELTEQHPLSKLNIFKRIKDIYDACSCKVCECISNKPLNLRDDYCKCKPCQCQDCVKSRKIIEEKITRKPHSGCPCIRCDSKECRGIAQDTCEIQSCECDPNVSIQTPENIAKLCKCEPCQCLKCRLLGARIPKTVKLGLVDQFIVSEACQCSPCECIECKQIYNRTNPTIMCMNSTDMAKYPNCDSCNNCHKEHLQLREMEKCKCEKYNRAIRCSFNKNNNDYDVHTVIADNNGPFNQQEECNFEKYNNDALFTSLKNNYLSNSRNTGVCKCAECECIVCSSRDDSLRNHKQDLRHNVMSVHHNIKIPTPIINACKCTPCECEICSKKDEQDDNIPYESKCRCDVCDCINCDNASIITSSFPTSSFATFNHESHTSESQPVKPIRIINMNKNCDCNPCECSNCKKLFSCSSRVKIYSGGKRADRNTSCRLRKVMLVTPTTSESDFKSRKTYVECGSSTNFRPEKTIRCVFGHNLSTCHALSPNYKQVSKLYQDSQEYIISDNNVENQMCFKLNNPILDTASHKSIDETPILYHPCDFIRTTFKTHDIAVNPNEDKPSETKYNNFNIIHKQSNKITSNDSKESLPVFWTCCNETSHPTNFSRNMKYTRDTIKCNLNDDISDRLNKAQYLENKQGEFSDKAKDKSINQIFKNQSKDRNIFPEHIKHFYGDKDNNYSYDDKNNNLPHKSHECTDLFRTCVKDQKFKKAIVSSDVAIDYERATRVLCEAKAFSSKLIKMLDSFETANKQFESASQKFKVLHESLLNINESELNKKMYTNVGRPKPTFANFEMISEVHCGNNQPIDEGMKNENEAEREYEQSINKPKDMFDNFQNSEESTPSEDNAIEAKVISETVEEVNNMNQQYNEIGTVNDINMKQEYISQSKIKELKNFEILLTNKISEIHVANSTNEVSSQVDFNDKSKTKIEIANVANIIQIPTLASVMKKLDSVFGNITTADTTVATDDLEKNVILSKHEAKQPWQILKKNWYINTYPSDKRTTFQSPSLALDVKEAINAISLEATNENYTRDTPKPNKALANLRTEVHNLLNMPLLQINAQLKTHTENDVHLFPKSKYDSERKSMPSTASSQTYNTIIEKADKEVNIDIKPETNNVSCEQLKANFTGLRRVSDHTVLVKWNVPKRIKDVQGYELLVDGRAVQKIFSPMRSMAVVTCLPNAARVLLTIRTIASADCGHAPATSIVYRPRSK